MNQPTPETRAGDERKSRVRQAAALLQAVETLKATGGAVELNGVRIEPCDERGQTSTTRALEAVAREAREEADYVAEELGKKCDELKERVTELRDSLEAANEQQQTLREQRDDARALVDQLRDQLDGERRLHADALSASGLPDDIGAYLADVPTPADPADYGTVADPRFHATRAARLQAQLRGRSHTPEQVREVENGYEKVIARLEAELETVRDQRDKAEATAETRAMTLNRLEQLALDMLRELGHADATTEPTDTAEPRGYITPEDIAEAAGYKTLHLTPAAALVDVEPIDLSDAETLEQAVHMTVGAASAAWGNLAGAGVFDDRRARAAAAGLLRWLRGSSKAADAPTADTEPDPHCGAEVTVGGVTFGCQRGRDHDDIKHGIDTSRYGLVTW